MTAIIGYKAPDGEMLVAADSRIGWLFSDPKRKAIHTDHLQKIYPLANNTVLAFATNNIASVKTVLSSAHHGIQFSSKATTPEQSAHDTWDSVDRAIVKRASELHNSTKFILARSIPGRPDLNRLFLYSFEGSKFVGRAAESGAVLVAGSVKTETEYARFDQEVIRRALMPSNGSIPMNYKSNLLQSLYTNFQAGLEQPWQSVGEMFHCVYTEDGRWAAPTVDTDRIVIGEKPIQIAIEFNSETGVFRQVNSVTGEHFDLVRVDLYDFDTVPQEDDVFTVRTDRT